MKSKARAPNTKETIVKENESNERTLYAVPRILSRRGAYAGRCVR